MSIMMQVARRETVPAAIGRTILKTKEACTTNKSHNINEVIQSSIVSLENECSSLKEKVESKQKELAELLTNCSKQSTNLVKLHSEEQIKVKIQIEIQNFNNVLAKVTESRDVCMLLQQYFTNKVEIVNEILKTKDCIEKFVHDKKECAKKQMLLVEQFDSKFVTLSQELKTRVEKMNVYKNKSREEYERMMNEIQAHTELQRKDVIQLEQRLTSEKGDKRGLVTVNQFLLSQKTEITSTEEKLKMEADRIYQKTKNDIENMQIIVNENNNRVSSMKEELESIGKQISNLTEMNLQLNNGNKLLNNNLKELIEEENCLSERHQDNTKFSTLKETEINKLQQMLDEKLQLKNINNNLEEEQQSLTELAKSVNNEITALETTEDKIKKCNNDVEQEIQLVINADTQLGEEIDELNLQMEKIDHEKKIIENESSENELKICVASENLKMDYNKSVRHEEELSRNIFSNRNKMVLEENLISDLKCKLEHLNVQLKIQNKEIDDTNKEIIKYNDDFEMKLFEIKAWKKKAEIDLIEAKLNLDTKLQLENEIKQMKEDMAAQDVGFNRILQDLTENYTKKLQVQDELMLQLKASCESELHEREERNVQARCELKELTARITQLQQDIKSYSQQIASVKLAQNQCEKLINHLEEKLKKIGTVAKSTVPQQKQVTYGSKVHSTYADKMKDSPESDSSGLSFNLDENIMLSKPAAASRFYQVKRGPLGESKLRMKKKKLLNQPTEMKTSSVKQKIPQSKHKENSLENAKDDSWFALFD